MNYSDNQIKINPLFHFFFLSGDERFMRSGGGGGGFGQVQEFYNQEMDNY